MGSGTGNEIGLKKEELREFNAQAKKQKDLLKSYQEQRKAFLSDQTENANHFINEQAKTVFTEGQQFKDVTSGKFKFQQRSDVKLEDLTQSYYTNSAEMQALEDEIAHPKGFWFMKHFYKKKRRKILNKHKDVRKKRIVEFQENGLIMEKEFMKQCTIFQKKQEGKAPEAAMEAYQKDLVRYALNTFDLGMEITSQEEGKTVDSTYMKEKRNFIREMGKNSSGFQSMYDLVERLRSHTPDQMSDAMFSTLCESYFAAKGQMVKGMHKSTASIIDQYLKKENIDVLQRDKTSALLMLKTAAINVLCQQIDSNYDGESEVDVRSHAILLGLNKVLCFTTNTVIANGAFQKKFKDAQSEVGPEKENRFRQRLESICEEKNLILLKDMDLSSIITDYFSNELGAKQVEEKSLADKLEKMEGELTARKTILDMIIDSEKMDAEYCSIPAFKENAKKDLRKFLLGHDERWEKLKGFYEAYQNSIMNKNADLDVVRNKYELELFNAIKDMGIPFGVADAHVREKATFYQRLYQ